MFTKSDESGTWNFSRINSVLEPRAAAGAAAGQRPVSSYGLAADVAGQGWDHGEARRSVMIGDGVGGFLAVSGGGDAGPTVLSPPRGFAETLRPHSSGGESAHSRGLWK